MPGPADSALSTAVELAPQRRSQSRERWASFLRDWSHCSAWKAAASGMQCFRKLSTSHSHHLFSRKSTGEFCLIQVFSRGGAESCPGGGWGTILGTEYPMNWRFFLPGLWLACLSAPVAAQTLNGNCARVSFERSGLRNQLDAQRKWLRRHATSLLLRPARSRLPSTPRVRPTTPFCPI